MKNNVRKIWYNVKEWLINLLNFEPKITKEEIYVIDICENLINKENIQMFISPLTHKRYLKDEEGGIFIIIDGQTISVINHTYSYNITITDIRNVDKLNKSFDGELEKRRMSLENEIKSNIQHSLKNILENLKKDE
ncbi:MAG: hypothetical protein ACOCVF_00905 [bacterium]